MRQSALLFLAAASFAHAQAQPVEELAPVFVTASRGNEAVTQVPFSHETISGEALRASPNLSLDGALRGVAGFSLFRRSDSVVAHPTAQGVSLRGLGPSGASRSLVLLDGVPLNDPFGGWVAWTKVPRESLGGVELVPGAGGSAWGNAALGGVVQLFTESARVPRQRLVARGGSFNTQDFEGQFTESFGSGSLQLLGRHFSTDGYYTVAPDRRGSIDRPTSSRARWATARWRQALGGDDRTAATFTVRRFAEDRGNGTPYQGNSTDETFASLALESRVSPTFQWNAVAYAQSQAFASTFSAVDATRSFETPASNQFDVPATAIGVSWVGEWAPTAGDLTTFGIDARDVRGETREESAFVADAFTRRRFAGGRQTTAGAFVVHSRTIAADARLALGLRADAWRETDGHRRDYLNGAQVADERYPERDGVEFSPSAGVTMKVAENLNVHASAQQAFRRPTLNELYRPFRVGNVITDANPALSTETVTGGEIGADFTRGALTLGVAGFWNELHDAVGNVTIASGPGNFPGIGFVPAGGEGRRRLNLDRARVRGVSVSANWRLAEGFTVEAQYLYNDATVRRARVAPHLEGRRLAQVPRHAGSVGLNWRRGRWSLGPRVRLLGAQFEDDRNALRLAPAAVVDVFASFRFNPNAEFFLSAENLFQERVETGRSADDLYNLGTPRLVLVGVRLVR